MTVNVYYIKYSLCKTWWYLYERCWYIFFLAYSFGESKGLDTISSKVAGTCILQYFAFYANQVHDNQNVQAACRNSGDTIHVHTNPDTEAINRYCRNQALI